MNKVKFAIVGCGRISKKHIEAIKINNNLSELIAVCDINLDRAKDTGGKYDIPYYQNYDEMLKKHDVDVVEILTESGNHARNTIDIIRKHKKHIVVEKPMALTLKDANEMINESKKVNKTLFVVKQNRLNRPVSILKQAVEKGKFGKIVMGTVRVRWSRNQSYYDRDQWRGTWAMDGGVFTNQASHHIDLLEWMLGEPKTVFAKSRTALVDIEVEDTGVAIITFKNGSIGVVEVTTATRPKDLEGSISILGEKGTVEIGGFAVNEMKTWNFVNSDSEENKKMFEYSENPPNIYGFGHIKYLENVCKNILFDEPALVTGEEGKKSLKLINSIYKSIETGREIMISEDDNIVSKLGHKNGIF